MPRPSGLRDATAERTLGQDHAARDYDLLEAAAARPQATVFGKDAYGDLDSADDIAAVLRQATRPAR